MRADLSKIKLVPAAILLLTLCVFLAELPSAVGQPTPDERKAFEELKAKAEKGSADDQFNLGESYDLGRDVPKDEAEAAKWFRRAAGQGESGAQNILGFYYLSGNGVPKGYTESATWFLKAAEQGIAKAQFMIGGLYEAGLGVPKDAVEAYKWYNLASAQGDTSSKSSLDNLENHMTPEQIADGQRLSREFKPRVPGSP